MKNIVIITSAIGATFGAVSIPDRFEQTKISIETVRNKIPNAIIILSDISINSITEYRQELLSLVDIFLDFTDDVHVKDFSSRGLKSHGELLLFRKTLDYIINVIDLTHVDRIYKLSGRHNITDEFDISEYGARIKDKYVFKNPVDSWISPELKLYETRFWSMDKTNLDDYISKWENIFNSCDGRFDIEHAYYKFILKDDVFTFDNIWVEGFVAADGHYQKD